ncbi:MAG: hypothetical protein HY721_09785, partial [Planctomycetes bacterium]|nr:hypothetical protein [Planctomycetota bacterium]
EALAAAPEIRVELRAEPPREPPSRDLDGPSRILDLQGGRAETDPLERTVAEALVRLGCSRGEACERVLQARESLALAGASPTVGDLLKAALRR